MISFEKFIMAQTGISQSKYRSCAFTTVKNPIQQALLKKDVHDDSEKERERSIRTEIRKSDREKLIRIVDWNRSSLLCNL